MTRRILALCALVFLCLPHSTASAGGLYLSDTGSRPLARGNAFVAGADDPNALWYNPAGLVDSGRQFLLSGTVSLYSADYSRIDAGGNRLPTVHSNVAPLPIPGLAYTDNFGLRDFGFGFGVFAPNAVLMNWPSTILANGMTMPAPQRYSLLSMNGSLVANAILGGAWRPSFLPGLSIGVTGQVVVASLRTRTTLSACDGVICSQPENPEYDSVAEVELDNRIAPTGSIGLQYNFGMVRIGASATLGYSISGEATMRVRLPSAALFDQASVSGNKATMALNMPAIVRAGIEIRPLEGLRIEGAFAWEGWHSQQDLTIHPENVSLTNVIAIGTYQVGAVAIPRNMRDTYSFRLGGEYRHAWWAVLAGVQYENGAFNDNTLTALTLDSDKVIASLGGAFEVARGVFIDATIAHAFFKSREVRNSIVPQPNPIRPPPTNPDYVGNGNYTMQATIFGLGLRWKFDATLPPASHEEHEEVVPRRTSQAYESVSMPTRAETTPAAAATEAEEAAPFEVQTRGRHPEDENTDSAL